MGVPVPHRHKIFYVDAIDNFRAMEEQLLWQTEKKNKEGRKVRVLQLQATVKRF